MSARKKRPAKKAGAKRRRTNKVLKAAPDKTLGRRVLGLDVSSVCVGYAVFDSGELTRYGKFHQTGKEHGEKLKNFQEWLTTLLRTFTPDQLILEQPYPGQRRHTYGVLSMYVAAVLVAHWAHFGLEMPKGNRLAAHRVKRLIGVPKGGSHAENKEIMVREINRLYGTGLRFRKTSTVQHTTDDDVADAIALVAAWEMLNTQDQDDL